MSEASNTTGSLCFWHHVQVCVDMKYYMCKKFDFFPNVGHDDMSPLWADLQHWHTWHILNRAEEIPGVWWTSSPGKVVRTFAIASCTVITTDQTQSFLLSICCLIFLWVGGGDPYTIDICITQKFTKLFLMSNITEQPESWKIHMESALTRHLWWIFGLSWCKVQVSLFDPKTLWSHHCNLISDWQVWCQHHTLPLSPALLSSPIGLMPIVSITSIASPMQINHVGEQRTLSKHTNKEVDPRMAGGGGRSCVCPDGAIVQGSISISWCSLCPGCIHLTWGVWVCSVWWPQRQKMLFHMLHDHFQTDIPIAQKGDNFDAVSGKIDPERQSPNTGPPIATRPPLFWNLYWSQKQSKGPQSLSVESGASCQQKATGNFVLMDLNFLWQI